MIQTTATAVANKVVTPGWQAVFIRYSFILGVLLSGFLTFILSNKRALDAVMWAVHKIPFCSTMTPIELAAHLSQAMLIAAFLRQGGGRRIVIGWEDLKAAADAQAIMGDTAHAVVYEPKAFGAPALTSTTATAVPATTGATP